MSIVKRGSSQYWYIQFQLNGQTIIRSSRTTNKKAAEQIETELKAQIHSQQFLRHKTRISLRAAITQYCDSKKGIPSYPGLPSCVKAIDRLLPKAK